MSTDIVARHYEDGAVLFETGDRADGMYIIRSGKVRIFSAQDGRETTLDVLKVGSFFGEMALFDDQPRSASAQVIGGAELEFITKADLESRVLDPVVWSLLATLAERVREINDNYQRLDLGDAHDGEPANQPIRRSWTV